MIGMRICYVSSTLSNHDKRFLEKFVEKRYEVHVVSFTNVRIGDMDGITFHSFPIEFGEESLTLTGGVKLVPDMIRAATFLRKVLKEIKPDVLHAGFVQKDGFPSALTGYHPFLLMPWGSDILVHPKKSFLIKMLTKFTLRRADMITCDAEFVKREIIRISGYPEDKIVVFPWGIDLNKFHPGEEGSDIRKRLAWEDKKILIMTRPFKPVYGIEYFLNSLTKVVKDVPSVRILLCGDGPLKDKFVEFVRKHSLDDYVFFAGLIPNEELPKYYNAADVYVSTSLSDGTSLSLLEAMACGLPTVVTDVPANLEWIVDGENGFVVPRRDSKILAEKLVQLLQDETRQKAFRNKNIKIAKERADWDKNFEKLVGVYETLLRR